MMIVCLSSCTFHQHSLYLCEKKVDSLHCTSVKTQLLIKMYVTQTFSKYYFIRHLRITLKVHSLKKAMEMFLGTCSGGRTVNYTVSQISPQGCDDTWGRWDTADWTWVYYGPILCISNDSASIDGHKGKTDASLHPHTLVLPRRSHCRRDFRC